MSNGNVLTSQPVPTAPPSENINLEKPSAINENVVLTQPMLNNENIDEMLAQAEEEGAMKERRRQRNEDFCCFACADTYTDTDDSFCWYLFCRMLCNGCGHCCQAVGNCTDSCCEGCANCCHSCCEQEGCCDGCCDDGGNGGGCCDGGCCDGGDGGCCDGGAGDTGDCDCDCNCFD